MQILGPFSVCRGGYVLSLSPPLCSSPLPAYILPRLLAHWGRGEVGRHLLLQLAELGRQAVDANAGLLQLLVGGPHQVAVPLSRLPGVIQLEGRAQG